VPTTSLATLVGKLLASLLEAWPLGLLLLLQQDLWVERLFLLDVLLLPC
jgi:hypothetical protein